MPQTFDIGAPGQVWFGTAATPTVLVERTDWVTSFSVDRSMEEADVTTLNPPSYARRFVPGLQGATGTMNLLVDSPTGAIAIVLSDIVGQRKTVDWRLRPFGTASTYLNISGSFIITAFPLAVDFATPVGGSVTFRVTGVPLVAAQ